MEPIRPQVQAEVLISQLTDGPDPVTRFVGVLITAQDPLPKLRPPSIVRLRSFRPFILPLEVPETAAQESLDGDLSRSLRVDLLRGREGLASLPEGYALLLGVVNRPGPVPVTE
jgi:hypothetical protein